MAKAKISQLNPKGSNLSSTDLFEVSVQTGSGYDTYSITGQEIVGTISSGFVPYTGATQDVDLGANKLSAESIYIEGTNGNGHLHLKHQNSDATATGQSTALWANSDGDIKWKNDNDYKTTLKTSLNTADRVYTFPNSDCTLTPDSRTISTTAPLSGGGDLSANITLSISNAEADGTTKGAAAFTASDFNSASGIISIDYTNAQAASGSNKGFLTSTDWTTFNNKVSTGAITGSGLTMATSRLLGRTTAGSGAVQEISIGTGLTLSGGTLSSTSGGLTIGTTAITSGTVGRILFEGTGNVVQEDSALFWDNTNKRFGVGATPSTSVRLDVRAQGALSTDIAFRVRNSADTGNHITVYGNDNVSIGRNGSASAVLFVRSANSSAHDVFNLQNGLYGDPLFRVRDNSTGSQISTCSFFMNGRIYGGNTTTKGTEFDLGGFGIGASYGDNGQNAVWLNNQGNVGDGSGSSVISVSSNFYINKQTTKVYKFEATSGNFGIGQMTFGTSATNTIAMANGTAPTTSPSDAYQQYSADIVAGNAAPHFRTENGNIIKLYRETTAVGASTLVGNAGTNITDTDTFDGYTLKQIVKALRNQGLLA